MGDFPALIQRDPRRGILSPYAPGTPMGDMLALANLATSVTATTWTANRAVYLPIVVNRPVTVTNGLVWIQTTGGNLDMGIYTWNGVQIIANGGVAAAASTTNQQVDFADTDLPPGWYFLGFSSNSSVAAFRTHALAVQAGRVCALQQQASGYPLPGTATFAAYATAVCPQVALAYTTAT